MTATEFLANARSRWHKAPDAAMEGCSDEERMFVRALEEQAIEGEFAALSDIVINCINRFQYARTYKTLRADLRRTLAQPGNPKASEAANRAVKAVLQLVGERKLTEMAHWFLLRHADSSDMRTIQRPRPHGQYSRIEDAIEIYAGKSDAKGCAGVVLFAAVVAGASVVVVM